MEKLSSKMGNQNRGSGPRKWWLPIEFGVRGSGIQGTSTDDREAPMRLGVLDAHLFGRYLEVVGTRDSGLGDHLRASTPASPLSGLWQVYAARLDPGILLLTGGTAGGCLLHRPAPHTTKAPMRMAVMPAM